MHDHQPAELTKARAGRIDAWPVAHIAAVDGWQLCQYDEWDSDGFTTPGYVARSADRDVLLDVSRFRFSPSQHGFAWLVRMGFPASPGIGPWNDAGIDTAIAGARAAA